MTLDNEQIIRQAYKIAENKDVEGWVAAFTDDGTGEPSRTCRQSCITLSGSRSASWSAIPHPMSHPSSLAPASASTTRDDLPTPGSPSTQTAAPSPWRRASTPARRVASSWLRFTHCGGRSMGHMVVTYALARANAYSMPGTRC